MKTARRMPSALNEQIWWRGFQWFGVVGAALIGAGLVVFRLWALVAGNVKPATVLTLLAGFWLLASSVMLYEVLLHRPSPRDDDIRVVDGATFVRGHRRFDTAMVIVLLAWFVVFAAGAVFASGVVRLAVIVVATLSAALIPRQIASARGSTHLVASPQGLEVASPYWCGSLDWDDIAKLTWVLATGASLGYQVNGHPDSASWRFTRLPRRGHRAGHPQLEIEALAFDLDPYLVGMALFTYWKYPHLRTELSTGVTRQRLTDTHYALAVTPPEVVALMPPEYRPRDLVGL